ncbi:MULTISPECIES: hypothetical protein [unclassified Saccharothrix]|uniref:hypothetical protein n=1 Tax=unclassified Saccharothrix TaxID=2593673 RepID=UPI00307F0DCF
MKIGSPAQPTPPGLDHSCTAPGRDSATAREARTDLAEAWEESADLLLAREAEAVLAEGGPTVTMAELAAGPFADDADGQG